MHIDNIFFNLLVWICVVVGGIGKKPADCHSQHSMTRLLIIMTYIWTTRPRNPSDALSEKRRCFRRFKREAFCAVENKRQKKSSTYLPSVVGC